MRPGFVIALALVPLAACRSSIEAGTEQRNARKSAGQTDAPLTVTDVIPKVARPGEAIEVRGDGFTHGIGVTIGGVPAPATVQSPTQLVTTMPDGVPAGEVTIAVTFAGASGEYPLLSDPYADGIPIMTASTADICSDVQFRDRDGNLHQGTRECTGGASTPTPAQCTTDGATGCVTNAAFRAVAVSGLAAKVVSGYTVAGILGTIDAKRPACTADGEQACTTSAGYKAVQIDGLAAKVATGFSVAGVAGTANPSYPPCAADGAVNCVASATWPATGPVPATPPFAFDKDLDLAGGTKVSSAAALLTAVPVTGDYRYRWADGNAIGNARGVTVFQAGGSTYFAANGYHQDGNEWSIALAQWDGASPTATWLDADAGSAGFQPHVRRWHTDKYAATFDQMARTTFAEANDGKLRAVTYSTRHGVTWPAVADSVATFGPLSFETAHRNTFNVSVPFTWRGGTSWPGLHLFSDGVGDYVYMQTFDHPTNSETYLSVASVGANGLDVTYPKDRILDGYAYPFVAKKGATYFMVAWNIAATRWQILRGMSPTHWDKAGARDMSLRSYIGGGGAWDADLFVCDAALGEPCVVGAEVIGDDLHVFYTAGVMDYDLGTVPANAPRGIGSIKFPIVAD